MSSTGAWLSFAFGFLIVISSIVTQRNGLNWNQIIFQVTITVAVVAPVWYGSDYGHDYHEGIAYYVEDGKIVTYRPVASDYIMLSFFTLSGCIAMFPVFSRILSLVVGIVFISTRQRTNPFYIEWLFVAPFFAVVCFSLVVETLYTNRSKTKYVFL